MEDLFDEGKTVGNAAPFGYDDGHGFPDSLVKIFIKDQVVIPPTVPDIFDGLLKPDLDHRFVVRATPSESFFQLLQGRGKNINQNAFPKELSDIACPLRIDVKDHIEAIFGLFSEGGDGGPVETVIHFCPFHKCPIFYHFFKSLFSNKIVLDPMKFPSSGGTAGM